MSPAEPLWGTAAVVKPLTEACQAECGVTLHLLVREKGSDGAPLAAEILQGLKSAAAEALLGVLPKVSCRWAADRRMQDLRQSHGWRLQIIMQGSLRCQKREGGMGEGGSATVIRGPPGFRELAAAAAGPWAL